MRLHQHDGFTLVELLITLTIFTLLLAMSAPGLLGLVTNQRLNQATDQIARAIQLTRTEAITRGHRVILCLSDSTTQCNNNHADFLLVFADHDHTGAPTSSNDLIQKITLSQETLSIHYNRPFLAFSPLGHAAGTNGTFTLCTPDHDGAMLVLSTLGRIRKAVDYDNDGLVEKTPGNPIQC